MQLEWSKKKKEKKSRATFAKLFLLGEPGLFERSIVRLSFLRATPKPCPRYKNAHPRYDFTRLQATVIRPRSNSFYVPFERLRSAHGIAVIAGDATTTFGITKRSDRRL